jgi:transglutaminase-like putative cysteine protease
MRRIYLPATALLLVANGLMVARVLLGGVRLDEVRPTIRYLVTLQLESVLHGDPATIKTYLPPSVPHQTITAERIEANRLAYSTVFEPPNRRAIWSAEGISGHALAVYEATVRVHPTRYDLPEGASIPEDYPPSVSPYLRPTESVQSDAPEIAEAARRLLGSPGSGELVPTIRKLYEFVQNEIRASDYENSLDAVTTLKWGEAFCGGKSRLLAALLRAANVPARLVGGLILEPGSKRVTHVWVEAWIHGVWVPLDALNRRFAEHPRDYLVLYYGDEPLFSRTSDIGFRYVFHVKKWRTSPDEALRNGGGGLLDSYVFWEAFRKANISLNLLRIVLLLPVGVLGVVFFRNVVGLTTFGTFHPALMAVAFRDTGLLWGILLYVAVLLLGMLLRSALARVELLHTPRLAILLVFVVTFMLAVTYGSVRAGVLEPAYVTLFPIVILTLTIESFFMKSLELGGREALAIVLQTLLVVTVVYSVMDSFFVQTVVFAFPEALLGVVAASLVIGRWMGMRVSEYRRFRLLWVG